MSDTLNSESEQQKSRRPSEHVAAEPVRESGLEANGEMPFVYSPTLLGAGVLEGRGSEPVRNAVMQKAQNTHGNHAVQRFLSAQRAAAPEAEDDEIARRIESKAGGGGQLDKT